MRRPSLFISGLLILLIFILGMVIGINIVDDETNQKDNYINTPSDDDSKAKLNAPNPLLAATTNEPDTSRLNLLEVKIAKLETRIIELEQLKTLIPPNEDTDSQKISSQIPSHNKSLTTDLLVEAGISDSRAAEIVRHRNAIELKKLELNDKATREGYKGSARYRLELSELVKDLKSLREDLGDDPYDYYLYASGQTNRIEVLSVMQDSAAEQVGIISGDYIISYNQERMFSWIELKRATAEGELGEYVSVDIVRDGQTINLWAPRGPLGVMLGTASDAPQSNE